MSEAQILEKIQGYLEELRVQGITLSKAIYTGSAFMNGDIHTHIIDLLLISPLFDSERQNCLCTIWKAANGQGYKIEPVVFGEKKFEDSPNSAIVQHAKSKGKLIPFNYGVDYPSVTK
ncbi:MAG: transf 2 protein [Ignavibacteria bacterium]|nr:transf 2 protein [Ignavibacteria bacterium]